jgi:cytochrome c peroxidase
MPACIPDEPDPTATDFFAGQTLDDQLVQELQKNGLDGDLLGGRDGFGPGGYATPKEMIDNDAKAKLGMRLFYTSHLSGQDDVACVTCHVNTLGGGDAIPFPIGPSPADPVVMGPGRTFLAGGQGKPIPRNSPTIFNAIAWDRCILMDCRIESIGAEPLRGGDDGNGIITPTVGFPREDPTASATLLETHLRFPINSEVVMRGLVYPEMTTDEYMDCVASKLAGEGVCADDLQSIHNVAPDENPWPLLFAEAFDPAFDAVNPPSIDEARQFVTATNITGAILSYEHTLTFDDTPLSRYIAGEEAALTPAQKRGALWFFRSPKMGGGGCADCHSGDLFSDEKFHNVGNIQSGPGKGHGPLGDGDFGRGAITKSGPEKFKFRTPTLLNVEVTGPYGHNGAYKTLEEVIISHMDPVGSAAAFDYSSLPFNPAPENALFNTEMMLNALQADSNYHFLDIEPQVISDVVAFLEALTDPCTKDRACLGSFDPFNAGLDEANTGLLHPRNADGCSLVEVGVTCN